VLGPGSDGYHEEHVHLDLAERRNGYKLCQWELREPPPLEAKSAPPVEEAGEQGEQTAGIAADEVPLPRPRPLAANLTRSRTKRSDSR
jgi:Extensin-like protein C-terminus